MKKIIFCMGLLMATVLVHGQSTTFQWVKSMGGSGNDEGASVAVDGSGNVYTTGSFSGTTDLDPGPGTYTLASAGNDDAFIFKLDAAGNFLWAKRIGGPYTDYGNSIVLDASGNVVVGGVFAYTVDFDPGPGTYTLTSPGDGACFISKLDASGNFIWAKAITGAGVALPGNSIALDPSGNIFTTGFFNYVMDFDPDPVTTYTMFASSNYNMYVSKLDASGNFVWAKQIASTNDYYITYPSGIATDAAGNAYATTSFSETIDFDPGAGTFTMTPLGYTDAFILKLDATGNFAWAKQLGGSDNIAGAVSIDASGNIYSTGFFGGTGDFDPGAATYTLTSAGDFDAYVSKLDASGNFVWAKNMGGTFADYAYDITTDASGNVYTVGTFSGTADFDPGAGTYSLTQVPVVFSGGDTYISKLDPSGNFAWAEQLASQDISSQSVSLVVDASGNVYTIGRFQGTVDFDEEAGTSTLTTNGSAYEAFIHKMSQNTLTGVKENADQGHISIYPNPTDGVLNIAFGQMSEERVNVQVLNTLGQVLVNDVSPASGVYQCHIEQLPAGMYMVNISSSHAVIASQKIIRR